MIKLTNYTYHFILLGLNQFDQRSRQLLVIDHLEVVVVFADGLEVRFIYNSIFISICVDWLLFK